MPEDYQALAEEFGAVKVPVAADPVVTPPATNEPEPVGNTDPAAAPAVTDPVKPATPSEDPEAKTNKAFADLRAKNTRYEKVITKLREAKGLANEDELLEALEKEAYETLGKAKNHDPEVLKRIDQLEADKKANEQNAREQITVMKLKSLQDKLSLPDDDVKTFVQDAINAGVDVLHSDMDFNTLYNSIYMDKIIANKVEAARQDWIARDNKADTNAAGVIDTKGKSQATSNKVETMAQLESVLSEINSNK